MSDMSPGMAVQYIRSVDGGRDVFRKLPMAALRLADACDKMREAVSAVLDEWETGGLSSDLERPIERLRIAAGFPPEPIDAADGDRADEAHAREWNR